MISTSYECIEGLYLGGHVVNRIGCLELKPLASVLRELLQKRSVFRDNS
jgi:hypothetical protein